jgi:type IV pilus assembly protein PilE
MRMPARLLRRMAGVTLMELLVVIAVLGTLAAIAVPSYRRYLIRSQRSEAKVSLMQVQTAEEKFYLQNNAYTNSLTGGPGVGLGMGAVSETGKYDISVVTANAGQTFVATATPRAGGGQSDDAQCVNFTINERGVRGVSGPAAVETCWT